MGGTTYSSHSRGITTDNLREQTQEDIFSNDLDPLMSPKNLTVREARDSEAHPNSVPIIIAVDVTASMGHIPEHIIKNSLTDIVEKTIAAGIPDPAIMFVAVGDHITDRVPLQVGQFESGDNELAMWLSRIFLEKRGGGNGGESYSLVYHLADHHVVTDAWEKRKQKGIIITIGDEKTHPSFNPFHIFNKGEPVTTKTALDNILDKWDVFHIHANDGNYNTAGSYGKEIVKDWSKLLGERAIVVDDHKTLGIEMSKLIVSSVSMFNNVPKHNTDPIETKSVVKTPEPKDFDGGQTQKTKIIL